MEPKTFYSFPRLPKELETTSELSQFAPNSRMRPCSPSLTAPTNAEWSALSWLAIRCPGFRFIRVQFGCASNAPSSF